MIGLALRGCPIAPSLVGEKATEEAPNLFGPGVLPVKEPTRGEIVGFPAYLELFVGNESLLWIILKVAETVEDVLGYSVPLYRYGIFLSLFFLPTEPQDTVKG